MKKILVGLFFSLFSITNLYGQFESPDSAKYLIVRTDDIGMSHSVNMALEELLETDYPLSASVMVTCPWYQEAVDILENHPKVDVGIHLTLNSEWKHYRWGPVSGAEAVKSLVDRDGYFFHSADSLYDNQPDPDEVEKELRAQIERGLATGLDISYVDFHMGTAVRDSTFRTITEKLANEYKLGMWGYFGSKGTYAQYRAEPEHKVDSLVAMVKNLEPGYNYVVTHVGIDNDELGALEDLNTSSPLTNMSAHRQAELNALTSKAFQQELKKNNIRLITFEELIQTKGLINMKRPEPDN